MNVGVTSLIIDLVLVHSLDSKGLGWVVLVKMLNKNFNTWLGNQYWNPAQVQVHNPGPPRIWKYHYQTSPLKEQIEAGQPSPLPSLVPPIMIKLDIYLNKQFKKIEWFKSDIYY